MQNNHCCKISNSTKKFYGTNNKKIITWNQQHVQRSKINSTNQNFVTFLFQTEQATELLL